MSFKLKEQKKLMAKVRAVCREQSSFKIDLSGIQTRALKRKKAGTTGKRAPGITEP